MRLAFFLLILTCSCRGSLPSLHTYEQVVMGMRLVVHTPRTKNVRVIIKKTFEQIDQIFNNWNPKSEVSRLNELPSFERVELSRPLAFLLTEVKKIVEITEGRFDPTVAPLTKLWKTHLEKGEIPDEKEIEALKPAIGWHNIHLEGSLFYKDDARTALDLCGVAKGYAVDLLAQRLGKHSYVEWGGEVATKGAHVEKRPWRVGIIGGEIVEVEDRAVATSGTYLQRWEVEGVTYSHLIDPHTLAPIKADEGIVSATVIGERCFEADAFATALMFFSTKEEAEKWAAPLPCRVLIRAASSPAPSPASSPSR